MVELADVPGDQLGHLEHTDLALAVKYRLKIVVRINLRSLFLILKAVLLDIIPKLLGHFRAREGLGSDNSRKLIVGLHRPHEGGVRLALGRSLGFRHKG
jgi:hypothetical protein